jgi:acyl carrier protein
MKSKEDIFNQIRDELVNLFDLDSSEIELEVKIFEDLGLDSIDAVNLVVRIQEITGKRIQPAEFREIQTIQDAVELAYKLSIVEP